MKQCKTCYAFKDSEEFYGHPKTKDGLMGECKECMRERQRIYRLDNLEEIRAYDRSREQRKQSAEYRAAYGKRTNYKVQKDWQARNPHKRSAHLKVYYALKTGKLIRPQACEKCGQILPLQAHHHDYSKPLDVTWICKPCHAEEHKKY